jgi:hypothetical protein
MMQINLEKYKFKSRSLPNTKTFSRYFESYAYFLTVFCIYNFVDICLFKKGLAPSLPAVFLFAIPLIFVNIYNNIEEEYKNVSSNTLKDIIVHIRLKQSQSLIEKLECNPEILKENYKKKSLLYWAHHYKNTQANAIIIDIMNKSIKIHK